MGYILRARNLLLFVALALLAPSTSTATLYNLGAFWKQPAAGGDSLAFTTSSFTGLKTWTCTGPVTVQAQSGGSPKNVASNTTVNLTSTLGTMRFYSDSGCTQEVTSTTINSGSSSASFYFMARKTRAFVTFTADATGYTGGSQIESVTSLLGCTWIGGTAGNATTWETPTNWSCGHMPTSAVGDIAVFDANCGTNCTPNYPISDLDLYGLYLTKDYTGFVRMSTAYVSVEAGGGFRIDGGTYFQPSTDLFNSGTFKQTGGTFTGGSGQLNFGDNVSISGGSMTLSSDTTWINKSWSVTGTPTINPNGGIFYIGPNGLGSVTINPGTVHYNNVQLYPIGTGIDFGGATFYIDGNFQFGDNESSPPGMNNVIFSVAGNVSSDQGGAAGNAQIVFRGANPVWDSAMLTVYYFTGNVTVNVSGTLTFNQKLNMTSAGQSMSVVSGAINMNGKNLTIGGSLTLAPSTSITRNAGVLKVGGATINAGSYSGGTIN